MGDVRINRVTISEPMWREKSIALSIDGMVLEDVIEVDITYEYKRGQKKGIRAFQDPLYMSVRKMLVDGKTCFRKGVRMKMMKISEFSKTAQQAINTQQP